MTGVLAWWDGIELWLSTLAYPLQVALLLAVLLPVSYVLARVTMTVANLVMNRHLVAEVRGGDEPVEEEI